MNTILSLVCLSCICVTATDAFGQETYPEPVNTQAAGEHPPSPQEMLALFELPEGFRVTSAGPVLGEGSAVFFGQATVFVVHLLQNLWPPVSVEILDAAFAFECRDACFQRVHSFLIEVHVSPVIADAGDAALFVVRKPDAETVEFGFMNHAGTFRPPSATLSHRRLHLTKLLPKVVLLLCILHGFLKNRDRCRKFHDLHQREWDAPEMNTTATRPARSRACPRLNLGG